MRGKVRGMCGEVRESGKVLGCGGRCGGGEV